MLITPALHFDGQCEDAIRLYEKAFNCRVDFLLRYADADARDWAKELTEQQKNRVYHSEVYFGSQRFMMADEFGCGNDPVRSVFFTVTFDTADEVRKAFGILEEDGTVIYPLRRTTYSSCMGSLLDKFGIRWTLMTEQVER